MNTNKPFVIISAERPELPDSENTRRTWRLSSQIKERGLEHRLAFGHYQGVSEESLVVWLDAPENEDFLRAAAIHFNQESILTVDANSEAYLLFVKSGELKRIGKFQQVSEEDAKKHHNYTEFLGKFYVTQAKEVK